MKFSIAFAFTLVAAVMAAPSNVEAELENRQFCAHDGSYCTDVLDCCSYVCNMSLNECIGG
jgi:hypothetical protein